jgi:predicted permease
VSIDQIRRAWARLRATFVANRLDRELDEELKAHLEMLADDLQRSGLSEAAARREAARKLGRVDTIRQDHREVRSVPPLDLLHQSLRYSLRTLVRTPVFTVVVTFTLAIGIGANTALFSVVDNLLLRSLPVAGPDQLVQLRVFQANEIAPFHKPLAEAFDAATFAAVRARDAVVADLLGFQRTNRPKISVDGSAEPQLAVDLVSANFFTALGVSPVIGRSLGPADEGVALISERWWRTRFGGEVDVLRRVLTIDGETYQVIGVAPLRFHGFDVDRSPDIWISAGSARLQMVARLRDGVAPAQAGAALHPLLFATVSPEYQSEPSVTEAKPVGKGLSDLRDQYRAALWALMGLVTLVLLTTCANVGNLVMLRNTARRRELALRSALGAGRARLVVHSVVETTLLAAVGCMLGVLLARWGVTLGVALLPIEALPDVLTFHADTRVLGFAAGICALSALLFGLVPAWRSANVNPAGTLQSSHAQSAPRQVRHLGRALVGAQVALSVILLVGAGLFVQTLRNLSRMQMGYSTEQLLQVEVDSRYAGYEEAQTPELARVLLDRLAAVPGVQSASRTNYPLMQGSGTSMAILLPGLTRRGDQVWDALEAGPDFFETMGIEVARGRTWTLADFGSVGADFARFDGPYVVNEAFVRTFYPSADPLAPGSPVIGVVKDVRLLSVKDEVQPLMFLPSRNPSRVTALQVRTAGDPVAMQQSIREAIRAVNPLLFSGMSTLGEVSGRSIAKERMVATLSGFFSLLGLGLAAIGIFGIASSAVAQRTKELGIRRALGAGQGSLVLGALRETLVVFALGLGAGALAAAGLARVASSLVADLLFGLTATDAVNLGLATFVMVVVAVLACAIPALRATRIDTLLCLRGD